MFTPRDNRMVLHVRFDGRSEELSLESLNLSSTASDAQIKQALATHFQRPARTFDSYIIVRNSQAIIVRPEAIYG
jgi:hypothetical protein